VGHASEEAENWLLRVGLEGRTSMIRFVEPTFLKPISSSILVLQDAWL
jgi:hypothetical protein